MSFANLMWLKAHDIQKKAELEQQEKIAAQYRPWLEEILPKIKVEAEKAAATGHFEFNFEIMPPEYRSFWSTFKYLSQTEDIRRVQVHRWLTAQVCAELGLQTGYAYDWRF